jgi:hypothetical protein
LNWHWNEGAKAAKLNAGTSSSRRMVKRKSTSRLEKIRARRENKGKRKPARKPRAKQNMYQNMPPVLMRSGFANLAQTKKKKGKTPKRRFDIVLSSPGVEMRLPAIPSISLGWRLLSVVLVMGLLVLFYHLWTSSLYQVQRAELEGNNYLNSEIINQALNLYNKPIFMIDPQQIEADLQQAFRGLVIDSSVQILWPATVIVTIQERQPIISWEQGSETLWVDAEGIAFEPLEEENDNLVRVSASGPPPAPIVYKDTITESEVEMDALEEILAPEALMTPQMAAAILMMKESSPNKSILTYDPKHGLGWHDKKRSWDVYFGVDVSDIEEKLIVYKAIKAKLKEDAISPVLISVEHIHAPYYRLEP